MVFTPKDQTLLSFLITTVKSDPEATFFNPLSAGKRVGVPIRAVLVPSPSAPKLIPQPLTLSLKSTTHDRSCPAKTDLIAGSPGIIVGVKPIPIPIPKPNPPPHPQ